MEAQVPAGEWQTRTAKLGKPKAGKHVLDRLTDLLVRKMAKPGAYADGGGLYLHVTTTGAKSWVFRYSRKLGMEKAKAREMGLGPTHTISLAEARQAALEARRLLLQNVDPIEQRKGNQVTQMQMRVQAAITQARATMTFSKAVEKYVATMDSQWTSKHANQWETTLATYAVPVLGAMSVASIEPSDVVRVLERDDFWKTKTETAKRVRQRIEAVLDWATVSKHREGSNPARWDGCLEHLLASPAKIQTVRPMPALPFAQIKDFMAELRAQKGQGAKALELAILTAVRSQGVRLARWGEFDLESEVWTVPAAHMKVKAQGDHRVPLSASALALLRSVKPDGAKPGDLVFPGMRNQPLSDMTLAKVIRSMNKIDTRWVDPKLQDTPEVVPHGFRSTFRDWASETTNHDAFAVEMALAHSIGNKVEAAYRRGELFDKRVVLMQDWDVQCRGAA
ncbi:MAG: integrase arm-type DNA-binding domain-containing protein [Hydrogenophaga sp.]|uniref:tyrosine-type recombinase/integrase n=1 Tax=Hydrogenophaga sp. TaxID=1904254 RepID=UPI002610BA89|nr:site-specific integrase [Hydrogenophaga sp.]MDM7942455.1 integrase arm-type DNA-binding domain-containing protein [Hydrogenophaga sp.]